MLQDDTGNVAKSIADALAQRIICGELQGGFALREVAIAEQYQVSRSSVREALLLLQRSYLVDIYPRRGAQVRILTAQNVQDLYDLSTELYILLGTLLAQRWQTRSRRRICLKALPSIKKVQARTKTCFANHKGVPRLKSSKALW